MQNKVSIIVLNWNRLDDTVECLDSCIKIDYPDYEVLVYDQNSDKNHAEIIKQKYEAFPRIKSIRLDKNYGFAEGCNIGIRKALEDPAIGHIVCLNNDAIVEPDFIHKMLTKSQEGYDMVGAQIYEYDNPDKLESLGIKTTASMLTFTRKHNRTPLFCPTGCAVLYTKKFLETVKVENNYFDPTYFCYAEDWDLGFRGLLAGFTPAIAETKVLHKGSASTHKMSDFSIYHTYRNSVWTILKNLPTRLLIKYFFKIKLGHLAIILKNSTRGQLKVILTAYLSSCKGFARSIRQRRIIQSSKKIKTSELEKYMDPKLFNRDYL